MKLKVPFIFLKIYEINLNISKFLSSKFSAFKTLKCPNFLVWIYSSLKVVTLATLTIHFDIWEINLLYDVFFFLTVSKLVYFAMKTLFSHYMSRMINKPGSRRQQEVVVRGSWHVFNDMWLYLHFLFNGKKEIEKIFYVSGTLAAFLLRMYAKLCQYSTNVKTPHHFATCLENNNLHILCVFS